VRGGKFIYSDFVLSNITINGNIYGIISYDCTQGKITNCSGSGISNNEYALFLNHSKNVVVSHCEIYNNTVGLYLKNASNNRVYDCEIYNNTLGLETIYSSMNKITKSLLHHNSYGVKTKSNESIFFNNSFWKNGCGIWIEGGMNNQIFHNNFAYNTKNAYDNSNNTWDVGYPSGGNYWSDYIGGDKYSGISQNITGDDGIGDIPYSIGSISKDRYPLINMSQEAAPIPNSPPEAFFIYYPQTPFSLEEIVFTDTSTDSNGKIDIKGWTWDFGDGNTSNEQNPKHAYGHTGLYNVTLTISDSQKENASIMVQIEVKNVPPTANFSWNPSSPNTQESIHFSDMSFDIDGSILNWTWNFGDGYSSKNKNTSHIYRENGVYIVKLTVTDNDGDNAVKTQNIFVKNIPPNADFYWISDELLVGKQINLTDNSNDIDGNIVSWHWEFGDDDASNEQHPIHSYEKEGKYTITLTIKDDDGDEAKIEKTIEIQAEKTPGFELLILILAALLIFAKRKIIFKK
jgi:parallel beta-helix repeat protein